MVSKRPHSESDSDSDSDDGFGPAMPTPAQQAEAEQEPEPEPEPEQNQAKPRKKKRRRVLAHEKIFVDRLPSSARYEKSYMHRDFVTHVAMSESRAFLVTASKDGVVKFWKKMLNDIEFVKLFKAHMAPITSMAISADGLLLCTAAQDKTLKFFDVINFDMINMIRLDYVPSVVEWIHPRQAATGTVAVGSQDGPEIRIYHSDRPGNEPIATVKTHRKPVLLIKYNKAARACVSSDVGGMVEYWSAQPDYGVPKDSIDFEFKMQTDLFEFAKKKAVPHALAISPDGSQFATMASDNKVRIFKWATGKLSKTYDEETKQYEDAQKVEVAEDEEAPMFKLDSIDFGRRMAQEREIRQAKQDNVFFSHANIAWDASGHFIVYPTMLGIKVINTVTNKLTVLLGKGESARFLHPILFQGKIHESSSAAAIHGGMHAMTGESAVGGRTEDPCIVTFAYRSKRFYLFTRQEPDEESTSEGSGRDVLNEKPELSLARMAARGGGAFGKGVVMHTTMGDIHIKLFGEECPKTIENFVTHCRNGFYDGLIFHRVIKQFMIQTGCPKGNGTGGESIWGGDFEDEIHKNLKHDRPGTLAMANGGPNTNGSQFFITTVPCPWLDGKHTVFGRVTRGMDVVQAIERVKVGKVDRPFDDVKVINVKILE